MCRTLSRMSRCGSTEITEKTMAKLRNKMNKVNVNLGLIYPGWLSVVVPPNNSYWLLEWYPQQLNSCLGLDSSGVEIILTGWDYHTCIYKYILYYHVLWSWDYINWLVVEPSFWKIWVSPLGWLFPIHGKIKFMFQTTKQKYLDDLNGYFLIIGLWFVSGEWW